MVRGGLYEVVYKMFSTLSVEYKKERRSQVVTAVIYKSDQGFSSWEFPQLRTVYSDESTKTNVRIFSGLSYATLCESYVLSICCRLSNDGEYKYRFTRAEVNSDGRTGIVKRRNNFGIHLNTCVGQLLTINGQNAINSK